MNEEFVKTQTLEANCITCLEILMDHTNHEDFDMALTAMLVTTVKATIASGMSKARMVEQLEHLAKIVPDMELEKETEH